MAQDESSTPKRGRHSAGRHAAPRMDERLMEVPEPIDGGQVVATSDALADAIPGVVPIIDGDQETRMGDAPRPIGVDPGETGSFQRIEASEGARVTTRANASETASFHMENARPMEAVRMSTAGRPKVERHETVVKSNTRVFIVLGIAALLVVAVVGTLLSKALGSVEVEPEDTVVEQTQASGEDGIEYRGTTYAVTQQKSGAYALTSLSEDQSKPSVVFELKGTPVTLILYNTVFIIPENQSDGTWDIVAHALGGGSVTQLVTDSEGNPVKGTGEITEASLTGDSVQIVTSSGERLSVSLV